MTKLHRQSLVGYGEPLCETIIDCPAPRGSEVLVRIERCGVCHSDLHMQDGYFSLGGDKRLDVTKGRGLPFTLGHEIAGVIETAGEAAEGAMPGRKVAVYPWIGCGKCAACRTGAENLCSEHRHLGIAADGGFATHVLIPHPRYLLDYAPLSPSFAGPLMCSGLTAYAALKRLAERAQHAPVLLLGLGGVGMMGLALARAMFAAPPLVADIDAGKAQRGARGRRRGGLRPERCQRAQSHPDRDGRRFGGVRLRRLGPFAAIRHRRARTRRQGRGDGPPWRRFHHAGGHVRDQGDDDRGHPHRHARRSARASRTGKSRQDRADPDARATALRGAGALDDLRAGRVVGRTVLACDA